MRGRIVNQMFKPLLLATGLVMFVGCSGQQQEDENLEATNDNAADNNAGGNENNNLGQDDAAEGNGQENFVDTDGANTGAQGADTNSATTDAPDAQLNANPAPVNNASAAATPAPAPAAAPAGGEGAPVPGGRVRYVKEGGVQAVNAPGGQPVMMIEQGEHPVTWEENGYLRIANGVYVPVDALSDKGVARSAAAGGWAH